MPVPLLCLWMLLAQEPTVVVRSTTRMVEVSVIAADKAGRRVGDLKKEDFVLTEDGKGQEIRAFTMEKGESVSASQAALPAGFFSNRLEYRGGIPNSATVILVDALNAPPGYWAHARPKLAEFLHRIDPRFRVAIYTLDVAGLRVLHDFTTDAALLHQRLDKSRAAIPAETLKDFMNALQSGDPDKGDSVSFGASNVDDLIAAVIARGERLASDHIRAGRIETTLAALSAIGNRLRGVPGRKNLVWLSTGFPLLLGFGEAKLETEAGRPQSIFSPSGDRRAQSQVSAAPGALNTTLDRNFNLLVQALNDASVAVYPVDARGMLARMDQARFSFDKKGRLTSGLSETADKTTLKEIAAETGGRLFFGEEIEKALPQVFEDTQVTYTVAYYPKNTGYDGKYRRIRLKVKRPNVRLTYRQGYYAGTAPAAENDMLAAVVSPIDATAIGLDVSVERTPDMPAGARMLVLQVDGKALSFEPRVNGTAATLEIVVVQKNAEGRQVDGMSERVEFNLTAGRAEAVRNSGITHRKSIQLQDAAATLRIVVRSPATGALGSVNVPVHR